EQRPDRGAARMTDEAKPVPAEEVRDGNRVADVLPEVVARVRRAKVARAVPGRVERDDAAARQPRSEEIEAAGVVQPAVNCEHGNVVLRPPFAGGEDETCEREAPLE